ncbi:MAG: thioredoxin family protein [Azospira oryzae]|uniref:Glutaredoxin family protein n=1 Tax=Pelomicrobium methylotrophicum TaxID=2602750 RepID=A0A5C7EPR5_9PROT|nr:glutaredoxin family protein [Pelomicrobium methylotrophicum]PZP63838.1 MAG: thioredoxin family protein [Azospira oryzae]PZP82104.1 MAG: thioredoxin family protein [Azospira oryzae]TXF13582.1 glutaredoxin family protein [Pelomicrobium methylotrophicum]
MAEEVVLTLYRRAYCHLCEDMERALAALALERRFKVTVVDVDADPALEHRYGERVPVLVGGGRELCCYRLDLEALDAYLAEIR